MNEEWVCQSGSCVRLGCQSGYWDTDNNGSCEYACIYAGSEICNGQDDDCDGAEDNGLTAPSPQDVCGVSPAATAPECTTGVTVACVASGSSASWQCTFPQDVCDPNCATASELCDNLDNDCDGQVNEDFPKWGQSCYSDDGLSVSHGACRTQGTYVCDSLTSTACDAVKGSCAPNCEELCDGVDNDCDGVVDEDKWTNGGADAYYVQPAVVDLDNGVWMFAYEASRPDSSASSAGFGNGFHCASCGGGVPDAPSGVTLDQTLACSQPDVLPWFNVSPIEAEQTCQAIGGYLCTSADYIRGCEAQTSCDWGYASSCTTPANYSNRYCNLGDYDFDSSIGGDQDGLLVTRSPELAQCNADWGSAGGIYDITGNLREITKESTGVYPLMGGAFNTIDEDGAQCSFDFYAVDEDFQLWDTGFRCCFDTNPN